MAALIRALALLLLAGCGRIGFDATETVDGCAATTAATALVLDSDTTNVTLCAGEAFLAVDAPAGAHLVVSLTTAARPLAALSLELLGPDAVRLSGPVWHPGLLDTSALATSDGRQLVHVESDLDGVVARIEVAVTPPQGRVLYIAPDGDDAGDGTTTAPWQTWPFALGQLAPGDVLIANDGTWTDRASCAGLAAPCYVVNRITPSAEFDPEAEMPRIDCLAEDANGREDARITVIARHQRRAMLMTSGRSSGFQLANCAYWTIDGLTAVGQDAMVMGTESQYRLQRNVFDFYDTPGLIARNLLAAHPNRCANDWSISVGGSMSSGALIEDSESYDFYRHGFFAADSLDMTLRRNYAHSRSADDAACVPLGPVDANRGDAGVTCYDYLPEPGEPGCRIENTIVEDVFAGFADENAATFEVLGSAVLDAGAGVSAIHYNGTPLPPARRRVQDLVTIDADRGVWNRGTAMDVTNATVAYGRDRLALSGAGISTDDPDALDQSAAFKNILALDNERIGFELIQTQAYVAWSSAASTTGTGTSWSPFDGNPGDDMGPIQRTLTTLPSRVGNAPGACLAYVPADDTLAHSGEGGAPIGGSLVHRLVDGATTDAALWNQRTGAFPCGAIIPGINDVDGESCFDVHTRLRVGVEGCAIPAP